MVEILIWVNVYLAGFWAMASFYRHVSSREDEDIKFRRATQIMSGALWPVVILLAILTAIRSVFK